MAHRSADSRTPTAFQRAVWAACARIPKGKVATYKAIAVAIGKPNASRAVGNALNKNPHAFVDANGKPAKTGGHLTPCHRVVASGGKLGGFAYGSKAKIKLLAKEGVQVRAGRADARAILRKL
jgi:O6-methylguanine-DNA--protein-cysteine methyltransferase